MHKHPNAEASSLNAPKYFPKPQGDPSSGISPPCPSIPCLSVTPCPSMSSCTTTPRA